MNHIDLKYASFLAGKVDLFKVKSQVPYRANFRCPVCMDSQKSKTKARGWILEKDNSAVYYCHNCGMSTSLGNLLKAIDYPMYDQYIAEIALEKYGSKATVKKKQPIEVKRGLDNLQQKKPVFQKKGSPLLNIKKIGSLKVDHPARKYLNSRQIPVNQHFRLYYASKFNAWTNSMIPDKLNAKYDKPRLVIPFIDQYGEMFGYTGRAFDKESLRYVTIMLDESKPKIFGLDRIDFDKRYYVVEGGLDSLFLSNAVAMAGADGNARGLENYENAVFVFDNEPRNKEIVARMEKCLDNGYKVCIWPEHLTSKDINDMVLAGMKSVDVELTIDQHTYSGLDGKLRLSFWRKV